jgi:hypothetical protein
VRHIYEAPDELAAAIAEFFPGPEWDNAASISLLESGWNAFATRDTRDAQHPCGAVLEVRNNITITAEYSIGWFQINACNIPPDWCAAHLYNTRHNVGTAHALWSERGWHPWLLSAQKLGLV